MSQCLPNAEGLNATSFLCEVPLTSGYLFPWQEDAKALLRAEHWPSHKCATQGCGPYDKTFPPYLTHTTPQCASLFSKRDYSLPVPLALVTL